MTEIEIATGVTIAAHLAAHAAWQRNGQEQQIFVQGSRARNCANANAPLLRDAMELLEKASRLLDDARARHARMIE